MSAERSIVALPTFYGGVKFRSCLEARWAMYFDLINVEWEYEAEAYLLPSGAYLPDFWLPSLQLHAEVKSDVGFSYIEVKRCIELRAMTGNGVLLLDGPPRPCAFHFLEPFRRMPWRQQKSLSVIEVGDGESGLFIELVGATNDDECAWNVGICIQISVETRLYADRPTLSEFSRWDDALLHSLPYGRSWHSRRPTMTPHEIGAFAWRPTRLARRLSDGRLVKS